MFAVHWIGIKEHPDGTMIYNFSNDTVGFTAKKGKVSSNETKCMALDTLSKKWESADCNEKKSFLCERLANGMYRGHHGKVGILN